MIIHKVEQGSPEWHDLRMGKLTASHAQAIGTGGKGLETLCYQKAAEIITKRRKESFKSEAMDRGNDLEEAARLRYELETGEIMKKIGFIEFNEFVGCSPDGMNGRGVLQQIKCPEATGYLRYLVDRKIDPAHFWQMQMEMLIAGAEANEYVVFNPEFERDILIDRVEKSEKHFNDLRSGFEKGEKLIKEFLKTAEG